jgi:Family of unknown function (DUF5677)
MAPQTEDYIVALRDRLEELGVERKKYPMNGTKQDAVLLHFIERAEQFVAASLAIVDYPIPLSVMSRVLCEDFFLAVWVAASEQNATEYEDGVNSEIAKMLSVHLNAGRAVMRNKITTEPASEEFMNEYFLPKLKSLNTHRTKVEQIAKAAGLQRVYDILYRGASLEVHGNTFTAVSATAPVKPAIVPLSSIATITKCLIAVVAFPRQPVSTESLLRMTSLEKLKGT